MNPKDFQVRVLQIEGWEEARSCLKHLECTPEGREIMAPKALFRVIKIDNVPGKAANILKQEMLSRGGEAATPRTALVDPEGEASVVLMGTLKQYRELCTKLKRQPFGLSSLAEEIQRVLENWERVRPDHLCCRGHKIPWNRTLVMGILNVTPDSFSDGGKYTSLEAALEQAHRMVEEGADIIDIGGESTRLQANPAAYGGQGWQPLPVEEELDRIMPVLERLLKEVPVPISVDTYKAKTAEAVLKAGAHMINDVWGLQYDPEMAEVVARYGAPVVVMHNQIGYDYKDLMGDIYAYLKRSVRIAEEAGIPSHQIIIDPGIGFGKTREQSLAVLRRLSELRSLGKPILLGTSRKSFIGKTLDLPVDQRLEGTAATVAWGIAQGAAMIRVHDVKEMVRVARMMDAILSISCQ
ncbi:MAG TPA: dihydropteroate synthase [Moorella mulderi]|nr:dihydropteroate synthase [Moorella mulderi]